jgi:hypothetical protein
MKISFPIIAIVALAGAPVAFADTFTVYSGSDGTGKVLGTCSDKASCSAIRKANPGFGESIVNTETGKVRNFEGRHHKNRDKGGS